MPDSIDITDVQLTPLAADQMTPVMARSGVSWYLLTLTLHNRSKRPVHVVSDIRRIQYDASRRVLVVQLSEHDAPDESATPGRLPAPPRYRAVDPDEVTTIVHPLSSPITFLGITPDGARQSTYVRLGEDVDAIECTVAYEAEEPAEVRDLTAAKFREHYRGGGTVVTASWAMPLRTNN